MTFQSNRYSEIESWSDLQKHILTKELKEQYTFYGNRTGSSQVANKTLKQVKGGNVQKVLDGKRPPMVEVTNNPTLARPNVAGLKYFGQLPVFKTAMDQVLNRVVGVFPTGAAGSGSNAFFFQNSGLFAGAQTLTSMVSSIIGGTNAASTITPLVVNAAQAVLNGEDPAQYLTDTLTKYVYNASSQIGTFLGANMLSNIDLTKPDEMVQMIHGASAFFSDATNGGTPAFDTTTIAQGVTYATNVTKYLQQQVNRFTL